MEYQRIMFCFGFGFVNDSSGTLNKSAVVLGLYRVLQTFYSRLIVDNNDDDGQQRHAILTEEVQKQYLKSSPCFRTSHCDIYA